MREALPKLLPRTFLDAFTITRALGIQFLWVDSLCIVQDDTTDWQQESSQMASIYGQSTITLAAASASSDEDGCLGFTDRRSEDLEIVAYPSKTGEKCMVYARESKDDEHAKFASNLGIDAGQANEDAGMKVSVRLPLMTRAWTMQELVLSPRVLHFGPREMIWECRTHLLCECGQFNGTGESGADKRKYPHLAPTLNCIARRGPPLKPNE